MIKKHLKPTKENKGGIISKENFIHISNIKNIDKQVVKNKKKKVKIMIPRLKALYDKDIVNNLMTKLNYKNKHEASKLVKIVLNYVFR